MTDTVAIELGLRIKELREAASLTQAELAKLSLKTVETISNFERGKTLPSVRTLVALAPHLDCSPADFFSKLSLEPRSFDPATIAIGASIGLVLAAVITQFPFAEKIIAPYILLLVTTPMLALVLGFLAAQGLARYRLPGTLLMRAVLVAPLTVSYLIIALGLLALFNRAGIGLSLWTAGIGHVVINLPLCFSILYASMGEHQRAAEQAARDLGAGEVQVLTLITAPMLAPAMLAAYFLAFTFSWDEFIIAYLLTRFDVTLPVEIWSLLRSGLTPRANAIGSLVFLVSVGVLIVMQLTVFRRARP